MELIPLQASQQGAGERIPVALATLWHRRGACQAFYAEIVGNYGRKSLQALKFPVFDRPKPDIRDARRREVGWWFQPEYI